MSRYESLDEGALAWRIHQVRLTVGDSGEFEAVFWPDARVLEVRFLVGGFVCRYKIAHQVLSLSKAEVIARRWADQVLVEV